MLLWEREGGKVLMWYLAYIWKRRKCECVAWYILKKTWGEKNLEVGPAGKKKEKKPATVYLRRKLQYLCGERYAWGKQKGFILDVFLVGTLKRLGIMTLIIPLGRKSAHVEE